MWPEWSLCPFTREAKGVSLLSDKSPWRVVHFPNRRLIGPENKFSSITLRNLLQPCAALPVRFRSLQTEIIEVKRPVKSLACGFFQSISPVEGQQLNRSILGYVAGIREVEMGLFIMLDICFGEKRVFPVHPVEDGFTPPLKGVVAAVVKFSAAVCFSRVPPFPYRVDCNALELMKARLSVDCYWSHFPHTTYPFLYSNCRLKFLPFFHCILSSRSMKVSNC